MSNRVRPTKSTTSARAHPEPSAGGGRGLPIWLPIGIIAAVVIVVVIALVATSGDDDPDTTTGAADDAASASDGGSGSVDIAFGPVEVAGSPLPAQPPSGEDAAVGSAMPGIRGVGPDGVERIFANGEPRVVVLMAHWCGACQSELNEINAYLDGGGTFPDGVEIQTVATWSDQGRSNFPPGEWLAANRWAHPTIVDDEDFTLAGSLGLSGTPMWIFVDADGTIVDRTGALPAADLVTRMEALLA